MRIVLLSAEYPPQPGGIGDYTHQLGRALISRGHGVWAFTIHDLQPTLYDLQSAERLRFGQVATWGWASWHAVIAMLDRLRPDVLHLQYQTGAYAMHPAINLLPWRLRRLPQRPKLAVTAHDLLEPYLFPKAGRLRRWVTRRLLNDCDAAIVTNAADMGRARELGCHAHLIPIGSNIARLPQTEAARETQRASLGAGAGTTLIGYFGLLGSSKGVDTVIAALAMLPASFRLVIIGGEATAPHDQAYAVAVREQMSALGLSERVMITGQVAADEVSRLLNAADIAALPFTDGGSFRRGSLLAALAHGLPVVTTNGESTPEQLRGGENVVLLAPGDATALAAALSQLAADATLRTKLSQAALALSAAFSWEMIAAQHEAVYK